MNAIPAVHRNCETLVDEIIAQIGTPIVAGLPLGLGKANHVVNALFRRAQADPGLSLTLFTALTLEAPVARSDLEHRFLAPLSERLFDAYPPLAYASAQRKQELPDNIRVVEFFLRPGAWLGVPGAQQSYASINYTHALDAMLREGMNLLLQLIAVPTETSADTYSLSCNPDISADLLDLRRAGKCDFLSVGQINRQLPFLGGAALRDRSDFDLVLDSPDCEFPLYTPPHKPAAATDHAIALHAAALVADAGTLQIGIGSIGDAIAHALILRQRDNDIFQRCLERLHGPRAAPAGEVRGRFDVGLYGLTEMLVEGFLALMLAGVIRRDVDGACVHAGFFLGSPVFYDMLERLGPDQRARIAMMPVSFVNDLHERGPHTCLLGPPQNASATESGKRAARRNARFINSAMMVTMTGAIVSDGLEDAQVVSGVGGQYNFVAQAFALPEARSIITLPATRTHKGKLQSNICWQYAHTTIPRHLRDIVVTEYGVADLRDKSDADVILAMLNIADSRFQPDLLASAKAAGKVPGNQEIAEYYRHNTPARITAALAPAAGYLPAFPLGSGLTPEEEHLAQGLSRLSEQAGSRLGLARLALRGWRRKPDKRTDASLARMNLSRPRDLGEHVSRALLLAVLEQETPSSE
ncbi:acetyl-CoA hydrolase/transferase C-terminal domain-containing protein [Chromatocurvus halotolerans]|uniref:Acyl-CoA hydrolase n=1 Tax=Chromatocurvus halotolerans TaxID=1132028 RepID=A0A4R2KW89_9GAMM|nr:acetyl-CoA hydrolase/transferase C-terminal domain-containing protein [Chromatocurvus halotolerans]TCO74498.1 acyl-CoA hydrolase [Chromatocurvus halotolerans]